MKNISSYIKYFFLIPVILFSQKVENSISYDSDSTKTIITKAAVFNLLEYTHEENIKLIYDSDFGETTSRIEYTDEGYLDINENDDFSYVQQMEYRDDGIYLLKADQQINLFLFLSKEIETFYPIPPIQLPNKMESDQDLIWEGYKVENDDTIEVRTVARIISVDSITVPAGTFEAIRMQTEITTSDGEHSLITQWLAPNIGRVKMHVAMDGAGFIGTILSLLGYDEIEFNLIEIKHFELAENN